MKQKEVKLRDLQLAELEILKEFIRICKELNLKYFLDSGTLLGCIRHGGFIPWDDDIDVNMPREDYEMFLEKGQALLKDKYFLQNYKTDKEFTQPFAKIRNSETTFIESPVKNLNINHGIYIDIFPYDGYKPEKKIRNFINSKKYTMYNIQISKKYAIQKKEENIKTKVLYFISNLFYGRRTTTKLLNKKEKIAKKHKYEENEYVCTYCYPGTPPERNYMLKEYFGNGTIKMFEGIEVTVPENYDAFLKRLYGDYMKLPPEEKRVSHHYNEVIDLERSYNEYINKKEEKCV